MLRNSCVMHSKFWNCILPSFNYIKTHNFECNQVVAGDLNSFKLCSLVIDVVAVVKKSEFPILNIL